MATLVAGVLLALPLSIRPRWLLAAGFVVLFAYWLVGGMAGDGYEDLDGGWFTAFLLVVLSGAAWSAGLAAGYLIRRLVRDGPGRTTKRDGRS